MSDVKQMLDSIKESVSTSCGGTLDMSVMIDDHKRGIMAMFYTDEVGTRTQLQARIYYEKQEDGAWTIPAEGLELALPMFTTEIIDEVKSLKAVS